MNTCYYWTIQIGYSPQLNQLRSLEDYEGLPISNNFRPLQPLNNRLVSPQLQSKQFVEILYPSLNTENATFYISLCKIILYLIDLISKR